MTLPLPRSGSVVCLNVWDLAGVFGALLHRG